MSSLPPSIPPVPGAPTGGAPAPYTITETLYSAAPDATGAHHYGRDIVTAHTDAAVQNLFTRIVTAHLGLSGTVKLEGTASKIDIFQGGPPPAHTATLAFNASAGAWTVTQGIHAGVTGANASALQNDMIALINRVATLAAPILSSGSGGTGGSSGSGGGGGSAAAVSATGTGGAPSLSSWPISSAVGGGSSMGGAMPIMMGSPPMMGPPQPSAETLALIDTVREQHAQTAHLIAQMTAELASSAQRFAESDFRVATLADNMGGLLSRSQSFMEHLLSRETARGADARDEGAVRAEIAVLQNQIESLRREMAASIAALRDSSPTQPQHPGAGWGGGGGGAIGGGGGGRRTPPPSETAPPSGEGSGADRLAMLERAVDSLTTALEGIATVQNAGAARVAERLKKGNRSGADGSG